MDTSTQPLAALDGGYPLAPICEQYLDRDTLGAEDAVESFIKDVIALYGEEDNTGWEQVGPAAEYARSFAKQLDPVTLNVLHTSWKRGLIEDHVLVKIRAQQYGPEQTRNYALLMIGIRDLPQNAGATRQFNGLHRLLADANGDPVDRLDLSTDESYTGNVALLRYSIAVTNEWPHGWGEFFLVAGDNGDIIIVYPDVHNLIWEHPDKADLLAAIVVELKNQNAEQLRAMVTGEVELPLIEGVL
jgi:hypothetical protein